MELLRLYKEIRRLHRKLPIEMRYIGNKYISQEFRLHVKSDESYLRSFTKEWTRYRDTLKNQLDQESNKLGEKLDTDQMDQLSHDQLGQLLELKKSIKK